ncbi:hypothetical protein ACGC1H_003439 [Rhizoctonia solani]
MVQYLRLCSVRNGLKQPRELIIMELSHEWLNDVVSKALGYEKLQPWQISAIGSMMMGQDVFAIAPTGAGKSTVMQGAVFADRARGKKSIAIIIVPTKSLGNDQVRSKVKVILLRLSHIQARAVNDLKISDIKALALHEDTLEIANCERPHRDLFQEVQAGAYSHVFLGPEMIIIIAWTQ